MTFQARNIALHHKINSETLKVMSSKFTFELTSKELEGKWNTIEVSHTLGSEPIEIRHIVYYAGAGDEEYMNLSDLTKELEEDGIYYDDIVSFVKSKINQLTTAHLSRCF